MSRFGPDPRAFFEAIYQDVAPWDVGSAQPDLSAVLAAHPPADPVLDVGCGTGDLSIALARAGSQVIGIDFAESAVHQALSRRVALPNEVGDRLQFTVADAFHLSPLGRFGAVVDSGFLHLFSPGDGERFLGQLPDVLGPGGRYYLLAFATEFDVPNTPRRVTEDELRAYFTADRGWRIRELRPATFQSRIAPVPAVAGCFERAT